MRMCIFSSTLIIHVHCVFGGKGLGKLGEVISPPTPVMYSDPQALLDGGKGCHTKIHTKRVIKIRDTIFFSLVFSSGQITLT